MNKKYEISVIIPIYNIEKYLEKTIASIMKQTIGFSNIQLILVNDGSRDHSEDICLKYQKKYPKNVVYVKQENAGVSAARNNGLQYAEADYINMIDGDDKWEPKAFEVGLKMLKEHDEIDVVGFRMKYFEAKKGYHPLDINFDKDKIVDINQEWNSIQMAASTCLIRKSAIQDLRFDTRLSIMEDCKFMTQLIFQKQKIGLIGSACYLYRKRRNRSSAMQNVKHSKSWFLDTPIYAYLELIQQSKQMFQKVHPYLQAILMYDMQWKFDIVTDGVLSPEEKEEYEQYLLQTIQSLDNEMIGACKLIGINEKIFFLLAKGYSISDFHCDQKDVWFQSIRIGQVNELNIEFDNYVIKGNQVTFYGMKPVIPQVMDQVYLKDEAGKEYAFETYEVDEKSKEYSFVSFCRGVDRKGIRLTIDISNIKQLSIWGKNEQQTYRIHAQFGKYSALNSEFSGIYLRTKDCYLQFFEQEQRFQITKKGFFNKIKLETKCLLSLIQEKRYSSFIYRVSALIAKVFKTREIWLVSDRVQAAGDNGEAFYRYLMKRKDVKAKVYFVIDKKCYDYQRLKKEYKSILPNNSFQHKILYLISDKIISSHNDGNIVNLFGTGNHYIGDLYRFQYVFLQHGVTKDDLSTWINVNNRKIDLFVTCSMREYQSFVSGEYSYNFPKEWIQLTGLPRYDRLLEKDVNKEKIVLLMPTWRKSLVGTMDLKTGKYGSNLNFKTTEYYQFYNQLINHPRLLNGLAEYGYQLWFVPHVNMGNLIQYFDHNEQVTFINSKVDYSSLFKKGSLLVTDYSSVPFDFAYLRKPVIYCQFDVEQFFEGQVYTKGYYDYEKDGFGPVCSTVDETVTAILQSIENDCQLQKEYSQRVNSFFQYDDQKNCERVYEAIMKLSSGGEKK
ncbi:MAG: CDP-glycerol glycerophosphotransferase family protein [Erysipelotrichaceae bacterium]|nr:CDP-glycerol glycerophosphotransferase family protein [Erysipelotrichaceae bacterium]